MSAITAIIVESKETPNRQTIYTYRDQDGRIVRKSKGNHYSFAVVANDAAYSFSRNRASASSTASRFGGHVITITKKEDSTMTTSTVKPDPKPSKKPTAAQQRAEAKRLKVLADEQAKLDAEPAKVDPIQQSPTAAASFASGMTIAQIAVGLGVSHSTVRDQLTAAGVDFSADKNALDVKDKVRQASAATIARRAANAADKAKVTEAKAKEREERDANKAMFTSEVVTEYAASKSVKDTAAKFTNAATGKPYSEMRIRRILQAAGVLESTTRGDTSERDQAIRSTYVSTDGAASIEQLATEFSLSAARIRGILKKGGVVVAGGTRGGKLPVSGTPEWDALVVDVKALTEKYGAALGTIAHAMRRASV